MTTQSKSLRLADYFSENPFAWPGGYPMFALTSDNGILCNKCCKEERRLIGTTTGDDGWNVVSLDVNWEDQELYCDHCNDKIESAYGQT